MDNKNVIIPRNLVDKDSINLGLGIKLKLRDFPFIIAGGFLGYCINSNFNSQLTQIFIMCACIAIAYAISKITYMGQEFSELLINGSIFGRRKIYYYRKRRARK